MYLALAVLLFQIPILPQAVKTQADCAVTAVQAEPATVLVPASQAFTAGPAASGPLAPGYTQPEAANTPSAAPSSSVVARPEPVRVSPFQRRSESNWAPRLWYGLVAAGHGAATFDAWSTRRVIHSGLGRELNPMLRPFANSNSLYAAVQVGPALLNFVGKRMMRSERGWVRKIWWLPQAMGITSSFASGAHNLGIARRVP